MSEDLDALADRLQRRVDKLAARRAVIVRSRRFKRGPFNNRELEDIYTETLVLKPIIAAIRGEDP